MNSPLCVTRKKQTASFKIVGAMLAIAPLWLVLAVVVPARGQTSNPAPSPADWTQFHRDNMQRWNPYETVLGVGNVAGLQLKWKEYIGQFDFWIQSSPAVVNGVLYVGSGDGDVYALNTSNGAAIWKYATGVEVESSPAVANGVVYVGSDGGYVYALTASTGALIWKYATGSSVESSPAVANGMVYVGSDDSYVYALNASTGDLVWKYATEGQVFVCSPAVANGVVYAGSFGDANVYALNAGTGALIWKYATGNGVESSPAVANGVVYFGSDDYNVYALNASTGVKLWSYFTGHGMRAAPAVANGVAYFSSDVGTVYALNASTGAVLWDSDVDAAEHSSPAVANGVLYISTSAGDILALNANTGALLWDYAAGNGTGFIENGGPSSPTIVDGVVYIRAGDYLHTFAPGLPPAGSADLYLRIIPTPMTVHQGDLITYAFPVWNLGPANADFEVLNTQVPAGTTLDYIRISGTPGLGTCTAPPYQGTGPIVCHENSAMAPNTTWTVRLIVKVTAPSGTVISENATATEDTPDPNLANNSATVSTTVQ